MHKRYFRVTQEEIDKSDNPLLSILTGAGMMDGEIHHDHLSFYMGKDDKRIVPFGEDILSWLNKSPVPIVIEVCHADEKEEDFQDCIRIIGGCEFLLNDDEHRLLNVFWNRDLWHEDHVGFSELEAELDLWWNKKGDKRRLQNPRIQGVTTYIIIQKLETWGFIEKVKGWGKFCIIKRGINYLTDNDFPGEEHIEEKN